MDRDVGSVTGERSGYLLLVLAGGGEGGKGQPRLESSMLPYLLLCFTFLYCAQYDHIGLYMPGAEVFYRG